MTALRPAYHFMPPSGWMNDPNGFIEVDGVYHLFYQYNPHAAVWDKIHWGHATSRDLLHWQHQPVALAPDTPGLDDAGCWSGCAVAHGDELWLFYTAATGEVAPDGISTGYKNQAIAAAVGTQAGTNWRKLPNPVIARDSFPPDVIGVRDPVVWREGDGWYMSIGAGIRGKGGGALLYHSRDLHEWQSCGWLHQADVGEVWECPQLLTFDGDRAALLVNIWHPGHRSYTAYYSGTYRDGQFTPSFFRRLELENTATFAPQATRDAQGRWLMFGWLVEERAIPARVAAGWAGVMSLPRIVSMADDGTLRLNPAPELAALRGLPLANGQSSQTCEMILALERDAVGNAEFRLPLSADGAQFVQFTYDSATQQLAIDRSYASSNNTDDLATDVVSGILSLATDEPLRLHLFVDHSVIEIFANGGRACGVLRVYPEGESPLPAPSPIEEGGQTIYAMSLLQWRGD
jgi:beta-fructofuranosidase